MKNYNATTSKSGLTRGGRLREPPANHTALTGKNLGVLDRCSLIRVVAYKRWSHMEIRMVTFYQFLFLGSWT